MARPSLYSRSPARAAQDASTSAARPAPAAAGPAATAAPDTRAEIAAPAIAPPPGRTRWAGRLRQRLQRHERWLWAGGLLLAMGAAGWPAWTAKVQRPPTLDQIDAALRESFVKEPLQSPGLSAYEAILPSVVRVVGEPARPLP